MIDARAPAAAVVALKPSTAAKSRLGPLDPGVRADLAWAMATDTLTALAAALPYVLVVSRQPDLAERLRQTGLDLPVHREPEGGGLNPALTAGAGAARSAGFGAVLACVADLPALRPDSVRAVLAAAHGHPRAYLADRSGTGTTMLLAGGTDLAPAFGAGSAVAHRASGAHPLQLDAADARTDVDTLEDLTAVCRLGVGPATAAVLDRLPPLSRPGRPVRAGWPA